MGNSWQDNVEEKSKKFLAVSKEQIDYYLIHKEFAYIKKRSLSTVKNKKFHLINYFQYLENEKKNLHKHFYDRTFNMLKTVENMENNNIRNKIRQITEEAYKKLLQVNKNLIFQVTVDDSQRASLHNSSFQSALEGLRTGNMTYTNDPLLPIFISEVNSQIQPLKKLTKEEESKLFSLTADQKKLIADGDARAKTEYLSAAPSIASASVKSTEIFKSITSRMKRRVESTF